MEHCKKGIKRGLKKVGVKGLEKHFFCYFFKQGDFGGNMTSRLTWEEYQRIKNIKRLDLEICDYRHVNILNLG